MKTYVIATSPKGKSIPNYFFALSKKLSCQGNRVVLVLDQRPEVLAVEEGLEIEVWPSVRPTKFADFRFFYRLCKKLKPDVVLGQFGSTNIVLMTGWLLRVPNRLVYWHTMFLQLSTDAAKLGWKQKVDHFRKRKLLQSVATAMLTNSEATKQDLLTAYGMSANKVKVSHYLIPDVFQGRALEKRAAREFAISFVGRLDASKGQAHVIREMPSLLKAYPDLILYLIGDGAEKFNLEALSRELGVEKQVVFTGDIDLQEVYAYMSNTLAHISASKAEAFGLVNAEALSAGTPILANKVGGIADILIDGENGYFFDPESTDDLSQKLTQILEGDWDELSMAARQRFLDEFVSNDDNLKTHVSAIESLLR